MTSKTETLSDKKIGTILFVDDEALSLKYFKASVGKYASVRTASSPAAAMDILEAEGDNISVVVSDERMPRESGVSFLSDVRKGWPSTVRILTSAYADIENLQHAINDAAIYRFVPKPWNLDELCSAMRDALEVEHSAQALVEPVLGPASGGDAQDANLALLSILAASLDTPLKSVSSEALQLAGLGGQAPLDAPNSAASYSASWSSRLQLSKITAAADQINKDAEHCRSLAASIAKLATGLASPSAIQASSMADTLHEIIEQSANSHPGGPTLDVSCDFPYRMPREIMKFVLTSLLRGGTAGRQRETPSSVNVKLFTGAAHNEVRINLGAANASASLDDNRAWRTIRSALWAFGGELLTSTDEDLGKSTLIVCVPKATP